MKEKGSESSLVIKTCKLYKLKINMLYFQPCCKNPNSQASSNINGVMDNLHVTSTNLVIHVSSVPQFASHLRFLGFSFWFFLNWGFGFPVALISSHWTRIEHVLPIFFVDYGDFAFSDLLLMPLCFGEINRLISVRDLYCRVC